MPGIALVVRYTVVNKIDMGICAHGTCSLEREIGFQMSH